MDKTRATSALADAAKCAKATSPTPIDDSAITACYNGNRGDALLADASAVWNKAYPSRATVPCIQVRAVGACARGMCSLWPLLGGLRWRPLACG